ncbi:MAG: hypothetical protein HZA01_10235 [Nitrospinae bacterium]|nr:hypothetical protein [Nitrospinota bacterium]
MKTRIPLVAVMLLAMCSQVHASQEFRASLGGWYSFGKADWKISGPMDPAGGPEMFESALDFKNLDAPLLILSAEWDACKFFSVDFQYGWNDVRDGNLVDRDFVLGPVFGPQRVLFSEARARATGNTRFIDGNLDFHVWESPEGGLALDLVLGYLRYEDRLHISNGLQTVSDVSIAGIPIGGMVEDPPLEIAGLNSFYNFRWQAPKLGFKSRYDIAKKLSALGNFGFFPWIDYRGEAFWNLRPEFKSTPPNYIHKARGGTGCDIQVSLLYQALENLSLELGYRFFEMRSGRGKDTTFMEDGSRDVSDLNEVRMARRGPVAKAVFVF